MSEKNSKKGFTLVELLAVIVILAIILVIAVPKVMSIIKDVRISTLESTAKLVALSAEKKKVENEIVGDNEILTCENVVKINDIDYENCYIEFVENKAVVTIIGSGTFKGMNACEATKTDANITERCLNKKVEVTLELNGGIATDISGIYKEGTVIDLEDATKENSTFLEYKVVSGNSTISNNKLTVGSTNTIIHAFYETWPSLEVDLDEGIDNTTYNEKYKSGTIIELEVPTKDKYTFTGWKVISGNGIVSGNIFTMGSEDTIVIAEWEKNKYEVIFDANGGTGTMGNQIILRDEYAFIKANTYTRSGYKFIEWNTEPDGSGTSYLNKLEVRNFTNNSTITLYAQWVSNATANFNKVFEQVGACKFNGKDTNITGANCTNYTNANHINTGVKLYSNTNYSQDYEIYFVIDEYSSSAQNKETLQTFMNAKYESSVDGYPGIVFRRDETIDQFEITQTINGDRVTANVSISGLSSVRIIRKNCKIYYSINDGGVKILQDISGTNHYSDTPVTFGASLQGGNETTPFRFIIATLSNMYIKLGSYYEE